MIQEPPAMPFTRSAFAGLLEPLDRRVIARAVGEHNGNRGVGSGDNAWTCERHLKTLLFAQFAGLKSLREIVVARADKDEPLYLPTNDLERPAMEIARLYKERWNIELLSNGSSRT
jgi:hypothetical protein